MIRKKERKKWDRTKNEWGEGEHGVVIFSSDFVLVSYIALLKM